MRGSAIRSKFDAIIMKAKACPRIELLFLIAVASIFMPFLITGVALLVLGIYALVNKQTVLGMLKTKGSILLVLFSVLMLVVPMFHKWWVGSLTAILFIFIIIFFLVAHTIMTQKLYNKALDIACIMSTVCFVYAVVQKIVNGINFRSTAGLLNANYYATIIEFVVLISVYRMLISPKSYKRYLPIVAINIIGLFLCDCQSAWIPIAFGVLILLYFNGYKRHALVFLVIAVSLAIIFILVPGILPRLELLPQTFEKRLDIWGTSIRGFRQSPIFGRGPLGYMDIYSNFGGYATYHSHSVYLDPLLSHGIVGTLLILAYVFMKLAIMHKTRLGTNSRAVKSLIVGVISAVCIHGITDYTIFWMQTGMLFCLVMSGVAIKKCDLQNKK